MRQRVLQLYCNLNTCRVVREYNLPDSFSSVLQRAMDGAGNGLSTRGSEETDVEMFSGGDTPEAGDSRLYREGLAGSLHYVPVTSSDQPLSDIMPDIALAGAAAAFSSLSLSRSVPTSSRGSPPPLPLPLPPSLSPDVVEVAESGAQSRWSPRSSVQHSYRQGPSHMFL